MQISATVKVILLSMSFAHVWWFGKGMVLSQPSFSSGWLPMRSQDVHQSYIAIRHDLGHLPIFVQVQTRAVDGANAGFIFDGVGSAQREDSANYSYGGVVYTYNETWVRVMAPQQASGYARGCLIYTGGTHWGTPHQQCSHNGEVKVDVWAKDDFPASDYTTDWFEFASGEGAESFREIPHALGQRPSLVRVQYQDLAPSPDDIGFTSDGFGAAQCDDDDESSDYGGIVFAYDNDAVRIWAPSANNVKHSGHLFFAGNGWGNGNNAKAFDRGIVRVTVWASSFPAPDFRTNGTLQMGPYHAVNSYETIDIPPDVLPGIVLVEVRAVTGVSNGFTFYGTGAQQACVWGPARSYGGVVYAHNSSTVRVWTATSGGYILNVNDGWAVRSFGQSSSIGNITVKIFKFVGSDEGKSTFPSTTSSLPTVPSTVQESLNIIEAMISLFNYTASAVMETSATMENRLVVGQWVLDEMEEVMSMAELDGHDELTAGETKVLTNTTILIVDLLSKYILSGSEPISGPVTLSTSSFLLYLERDSPEVLCNRTVMLRHNTGFDIPPAAYIFPNPRILETAKISMAVFQMSKKFHSVTAGESNMTTDVLTLSFFDETNSEIEVRSTEQDIGIHFGKQAVPAVSATLAEGWCFHDEEVVHFEWTVENIKPFHAIKIVLNASELVEENTTLFMSKRTPDFNSDKDVHLFHTGVEFKGNITGVFIPEDEVVQSGRLDFAFDLKRNNGVYFMVVVTQHRCNYWNENQRVWDRRGCKVSSKSGIDATVCLCNHLTAFTSSTEQVPVANMKSNTAVVTIRMSAPK